MCNYKSATETKTFRINAVETMEGKRGRGRSRQKLMDWMMEDGYGKVKEKAQH